MGMLHSCQQLSALVDAFVEKPSDMHLCLALPLTLGTPFVHRHMQTICLGSCAVRPVTSVASIKLIHVLVIQTCHIWFAWLFDLKRVLVAQSLQAPVGVGGSCGL